MKTGNLYPLLLAAALLTGCGTKITYVYPVVEITLSCTEAHVRPGESLLLTAELAPENATDRTVVWSSADPAVATIDASGLLTGVAAGETLVTATAGDRKAACTVTVGPDVYVAGMEAGYPVLWKNYLLVWKSDVQATVGQIVRSGEDLYLPAFFYGSGASKAGYFRNGEPVYLPTEEGGTSEAYSLAVAGDDIYVAGCSGSTDYYATLWVNGTPRKLSDIYSFATGVCLDGNDVYVCGWECNEDFSNSAVLWKNGEKSYLEVPEGYINPNATGLAVRDGKVCVIGTASLEWISSAALWIDGRMTPLSDKSSYADAIRIDGEDVYVAGSVASETFDAAAVVWKNGQAVYLTGLEHAEEAPAEAKSIAVAGGRTYVAGQQARKVGGMNFYHATLWTDGVVRELRGTDPWLETKAFSVLLVE